jgi:hypothetical protein
MGFSDPITGMTSLIIVCSYLHLSSSRAADRGFGELFARTKAKEK